MFYNPVRVVESEDWLGDCQHWQRTLGISNPLVISSNGSYNRHTLSKHFDKSSIYHHVKANPTFESCQAAIDFSRKIVFDGMIAIGGGSALDTAKAVLATRFSEEYSLRRLFTKKMDLNKDVPFICIPTTHGSGSEVTMWGTIWDLIEKKKFSISNPKLYPDVAILDPSLMFTLPLGISIIGTLDALSHSFEAIWNKNANEKSTALAIQAICLILKNVELLKQNTNNLESRKELLRASNLAGLAISNTQTAAAHAISYPLTLIRGIPHGIAAAMVLIPLLKRNENRIRPVLKEIISKIGLTDVDDLYATIKNIPQCILGFSLSSLGVEKEDIVKEILPRCFTKERMKNNIITLELGDVKEILLEMYM